MGNTMVCYLYKCLLVSRCVLSDSRYMWVLNGDGASQSSQVSWICTLERNEWNFTKRKLKLLKAFNKKLCALNQWIIIFWKSDAKPPPFSYKLIRACTMRTRHTFFLHTYILYTDNTHILNKCLKNVLIIGVNPEIES